MIFVGTCRVEFPHDVPSYKYRLCINARSQKVAHRHYRELRSNCGRRAAKDPRHHPPPLPPIHTIIYHPPRLLGLPAIVGLTDSCRPIASPIEGCTAEDLVRAVLFEKQRNNESIRVLCCGRASTTKQAVLYSYKYQYDSCQRTKKHT